MKNDAIRSSPDVIRSSSDVIDASSDAIRSSPDVLRSSSGVIRSSSDVIRSSSDVIHSSPDVIRSSSGVIRSDVRHASPDATPSSGEMGLIYRPNLGAYRVRRLVDVSLALMLMVIAVPIVAIACLTILLEDGRPLFFRQRRAGRFERVFTIYKLRTMRKDLCHDAQSPTHGRDPRITSVGRFLRKASIDELPQLLNVLLGDMTIIGPRPEMPIIIGKYERWQHLRHLITPGITCIWQATCRSRIPLNHPEATALDIDYIRRASPALDGSLLVRTFLSVVLQRGAC
jgi:lipopolysaccharide/colanic/teichoic acid biosynthesis glycosyltransferase